MGFEKLRNIRKATSPGFSVNYGRSITLNSFEEKSWVTYNAVHQQKILDRLSQIPPNTLRWTVVSNTSRKALPLATQRNRLRRQWAGAFVTALRSRGMKSNGQPINGQHPTLSGTLEMVIFNAQNWGAPSALFLERTTKTVDELLKLYPGSQTIDEPSRIRYVGSLKPPGQGVIFSTNEFKHVSELGRTFP